MSTQMTRRKKKKHGHNLNLDLLELIRTTVSRILSTLGTEFWMLTHLRLTLFSAYDLATIGTHISDKLANQLRQFWLEYTDGTGPGGDLQYTLYWQGDEDSDEDEDMPYSNLQTRYPNTDHMAGLCTYVSRCHNLKCLGLVGTQCIDLSSLDWQPANTGLEGIYLHRVVVTSAQIISLLSPSATSSTTTPNITTADIENVQFFDRTWGIVFHHLETCPSLTYLYVYNLVYAKYSESAEHREHNNRPFENVSTMWSENEEDSRSLRRLARRVEGRGGTSGVIMSELDGSDDEGEELGSAMSL
jgi:hypothetical protein